MTARFHYLFRTSHLRRSVRNPSDTLFSAFALTAFLFSRPLLNGQTQRLNLQVSDLSGRPVPGAILSGADPSTVSPPSDIAGRTYIDFVGGDNSLCKTLRIVKPELVFISPWDACVPLRPPGAQHDAVLVVVSRPGAKAMLISSAAMKALAGQSIEAAKQSQLSGEDPQNALQDSVNTTLKRFGFERSQIEAAVTQIASKEKDSDALRALNTLNEILKQVAEARPQQQATNGSLIIGSGTLIKDVTISSGMPQGDLGKTPIESTTNAEPFKEPTKTPREPSQVLAIDDEKIEMLRISCAENLGAMWTRSRSNGKVVEESIADPDFHYYEDVCKENISNAAARDFVNPTWYASWANNPVLCSCTANLNESDVARLRDAPKVRAARIRRSSTITATVMGVELSIGQVRFLSTEEWRTSLDGDDCRTQTGSAVTIKGIGDDKADALVEYSPLKSGDGSACKDGTMFLFSLTSLITRTNTSKEAALHETPH